MKVKKFLGSVLSWVLVASLAFTAVVVISAHASDGEPTVFGYQLKTVLSGSMEPTFQTGSIIAVKLDGDMTRFEKDDVITYMADEDTLVTHRVLEVIDDGQQYVTKGDNNEAEDQGYVHSDNVIGTYTGFTIPYLGYFTEFSGTKEGTALLLILPGIVLVIYSVYSIFRAVSELENRKAEQQKNNA